MIEGCALSYSAIDNGPELLPSLNFTGQYSPYMQMMIA
jgi:hypothetical protein